MHYFDHKSPSCLLKSPLLFNPNLLQFPVFFPQCLCGQIRRTPPQGSPRFRARQVPITQYLISQSPPPCFPFHVTSFQPFIFTLSSTNSTDLRRGKWRGDQTTVPSDFAIWWAALIPYVQSILKLWTVWTTIQWYIPFWLLLVRHWEWEDTGIHQWQLLLFELRVSGERIECLALSMKKFSE